MAMEAADAAFDTRVMNVQAEPRPYIRNATVCCIPRVTDEQVDRIRWQFEQLNPFVLVRRLTENTVVVEGIPVLGRSAHDADFLCWELVATHARRAIGESQETETRITSIDVWDRSLALV